jgi:hypothetical protein
VEKYFETMNISCFSSYFHLLISATINDFYLHNYCCAIASWGFSIPIVPSAFFNWNFTGWNSCPSPHLFVDLVIYFHQYEVINMCFISWAIIHHYHNLFCLLQFLHFGASAATNVLLTYCSIFWAVPHLLVHKIFHIYLYKSKENIFSKWENEI